MLVENELKERFYGVLQELARQLHELSITCKLFSSATASAFLYMLSEDIFDAHLEKTMLYRKLSTALLLIEKIKDENVKIEETTFWREFRTLQKFLEQEETLSLLLEQLSCLNQETLQLEESHVLAPKPMKNYVQIGRSDKPEHGNDIVFKDDRTLSRVHLVISSEDGAYFLEDRSANGTFVNGVKIEKGIKFPVSFDDEIRIGRERTIICLGDEEIQKVFSA